MDISYVTSSSIIVASFIVALGFTVLAQKILVARALFDNPNERSMHHKPVPRGGGWALLAMLVPGMILTALWQGKFDICVVLIGGLVILAGISWRDDRKGVPAVIRLGLHILAACIGSLAFPTMETLFGGALPFFLDRVLMIIGWAWFMNLYNFMDGIDGITGVETVSIATGVCLVMIFAGLSDPFLDVLTLLLTGAALGFLVLNWHPAKIFLGDVGSVPMGYLTGFALFSLALRGHPVPALILPLYYLTDSGWTLAKRALRGEKIWQAHRQHFYQRAAQGLGCHDSVVWMIITVNTVLVGAAVLAVAKPAIGLAVGVSAVAVLLTVMRKVSKP